MHGEKRLSSSAAHIIDDLLLEILVNLPAKSLLRFQVVSKHWCSLISCEYFRGRHHRRNQNHHVSFILHGYPDEHLICDLSEKTLVPLQLDWTSNLKLVQSSNGLLLLDSWPRSGERKIYVYNPTTQHKRPRMITRIERSGFFNKPQLFLVYNPSKSPHYRVFMIYPHDSRFRVYHSRSHKWEDHYHRNPLMNVFPVGGVAVCNDRLYLIGYGEEEILCLSPEDDDQIVMSTVCSPPTLPTTAIMKYPFSYKRYIMESNGHLHCLVLHFRWCKTCFVSVYEMTADHTTWVRLDRFLAMFIDVERKEKIEVLGFVRGDPEREEDSALVYHVPGKIMIYWFLDKVREEIVVDISKARYKNSLQFMKDKSHHSFFQSLVQFHEFDMI